MELGLILLEVLTAGVIVFGALAIFLLRRRSQPHEAGSPALWLRFSVLLFVCLVSAVIEGVLLRPYGFVWLVLVGGLTVFLVAKCGPKFLLGSKHSGSDAP
jgi:hypothetical protein